MSTSTTDSSPPVTNLKENGDTDWTILALSEIVVLFRLCLKKQSEGVRFC